MCECTCAHIITLAYTTIHLFTYFYRARRVPVIFLHDVLQRDSEQQRENGEDQRVRAAQSVVDNEHNDDDNQCFGRMYSTELIINYEFIKDAKIFVRESCFKGDYFSWNFKMNLSYFII